MKVIDQANPEADILRLVRDYLCNERKEHWLMVIDNADDARVFFQDTSPSCIADDSATPPAELLSDFIPQSPNGSVLFITQSHDIACQLTGEPASIIEVTPMNVDDALGLLYKKLGSVAQEEEAMRLIRALKFMPLALTQAAAFICQRTPRMSLARYTDEVRRSDRDRVRLLEKDVEDSWRDGQASNSIITTWQISFEHILEQTPAAARLLSLMSLFDRQGPGCWL